MAMFGVLKEVLGRSGDFRYYPVVVFDDGCTLKKVNTTHPVIYQRRLIDLILDQKREVVLTGREIRPPVWYTAGCALPG